MADKILNSLYILPLYVMILYVQLRATIKFHPSMHTLMKME